MKDEYENLLLTNNIDNEEVFIDDILLIQNTITNNGTKDKYNLKIKVVLPEYLEFILDSASIDGMSIPNNILTDGISIQELKVGSTALISYNVKAIKQHTNAITYYNVFCEYLDDEGESRVINKKSEILHIIILKQRVGILISSTTKDAIIGDNNHFHIEIKNYDKKNSLTELQFRNDFAGLYQILTNTIFLNGNIPQTTLSPIKIDNIAPDELVTIDFDAIAHYEGALSYDSLIDYKYLLNGTLTRKIEWLLSLYTTVYQSTDVQVLATLEIIYNKSPTLYLPNFIIKIENQGTTELLDTNITMDLSDYCTMIESSLQVNSIKKSGDLTTGITISSIAPKETAIITFTGSPNGPTEEKQIYAKINYSYMKDSSKVAGLTYTNSVYTSLLGIPDGDFAMSIVPDKEIYSVGERINFKMIAINNTDYKLTKLEIKPNLPSFIRYLKGTTKVDNQSIEFNDSIIIEDLLNYGDTKTITFSAIALKEADTKVDAITIYSYDIITEQKSISESYPTNFSIRKNDLVDLKTVFVSNLPHIVKVGEVITFTLEIKNDNDYDIPISNVLVKPIFATNKSDKQYLSMDENSITQDNINIINKNNEGYFILNDILANQNSIIKFNAYAVNISPDEIFNYVDILYEYTDEFGNIETKNGVDDYGLFIINKDNIDLKVTKETNEREVYIGDNIHYNVQITNNTNQDFGYVFIKDYMDRFVSFKMGSLYVDGIYYPHLSLENGFDLTTVSVNETRTMEFDCEAVSSGICENVLSVVASTNKNDAETNLWEVTSNIATTKILNNISATYSTVLKAENQVGKLECFIDDIITFTITITNQGNVQIQNLQIIEELDSHLEYIETSLMLDGHKLNRTLDNILIDTLDINESRIITFQALCINNGENIENQIETNSTYLDNDNNINNLNRNSNIILLNINNNSKKVFFELSSNKKLITVLEHIEFNALIKNEKDEEITIDNLIFQKILDSHYFDFDMESVKQDGIYIQGTEQDGYHLNSLASGASSNITFTALAKKAISKTEVSANITYKYTKDGIIHNTEKISKYTLGIVDNINHNFVMNFSSNKKREVKDKNIYFTLELINATTNDATDIYLYEDLNYLGLTIVPATTKVNGVVVEDITNGVYLEQIRKQERVNIEFQAIGNIEGIYPVTTYVVGIIDNQYYGAISNTIPITILSTDEANMEIIQTLNKDSYVLNENMEFIIKLNNTGSEEITNLTINQLLNENLEYLDGSLRIDGIASNEPINNIYIGDFDDDNIEITFQCKCIKASWDIEHSLTATYNWQNQGTSQTKTVTSNIETFNIYEDDSVFVKADLTISNPIVDIHNMKNLTAQITIQNKSNYNINLTSGQLNVSMPKGNYEIVEDSFKQDEIPLTNPEIITYSLFSDHLLLPIIANSESNITFTLSPINNQYKTDNLTISLDYNYTNKNGIEKTENLTKTTSIYYVDKSGEDIIELSLTPTPKRGLIHDIIHYLLEINNISNTTLTSFDITNIFPEDIVYIPETTLVDGIKSDIEITDIGGLAITKTLYSNSSMKVEFDALAKKAGEYTDIAIVKATHTGGDLSVAYGLSTETTVEIFNDVKLDIDFIKEINYEDLRVNDQYQITLKITNNSNILLKNIIIHDILEESFEYVENSLKLNNQIINGRPNYIEISKLEVDDSIVINFDILVIKTKSSATNQAIMVYEYEYQNRVIQETIYSNLLELTIKDPINIDIEAINSSDKSTYIEQGIANFTITITNQSNIDLESVTIIDNLDNHFSLIKDTITIDDNPYIGDLTNNIEIGNLKEFTTKILKFQARALSAGIELPNSVTIITNYNTKDGIKRDSFESNIIKLDIIEGLVPSLRITKVTNNKDYVLNDIVQFKTTIQNIGECPFISGQFTSELNSCLELIPSSIKVDGKEKQSTLTNIDLGSLEINEEHIVTYQAKCINYRNDILVQDSISMNYNEDGEIKIFNALSNEVLIDINNANFTLSQTLNNTVKEDTLHVGQKANIITTIINTGELPIENLALIVDFDNTHFQFVPNSIYLDDKLLTQDIEHAILIDNLAVSQSIIVKYSIIPIQVGEATSSIEGIGSYQNKEGNLITITRYSNELKKEVLPDMNPDLTAVLTTSKPVYTINESIDYQLIITNTGDTNFDEVFLTDILDNSIELIPNSILINKKELTTEQLDNISLGSLSTNQQIIVDFKAKPLQVLNPIANIAYITGKYNDKEITNTSNFVLISVVPLDIAFITLSQEISTSEIKVGENIDFTLIFKNTGTKELSNLKLINPLDSCLEFVSNSVYIDDVSIPNDNIQTGIDFSSLSLGESHKVRFTARGVRSVASLDNYATINCYLEGEELKFTSNQVQISIAEGFSVLVTKTTSTITSPLNIPIGFLIKVINNGSFNFTSVTITDELIPNIQFRPNSILINGTPISGDIKDGITLHSIKSGEEKEIYFEVIGIKAGNNLENYANANITYFDGQETHTAQIESTAAKFSLLDVKKGDLSLTKTIDKKIIKVGEVTTFTITATNIGNVSLNKVFIYDQYDINYINLVPNTIKVDNIPVTGDIRAGIDIGSIPVNGKKIITFQISGKAPNTTIVNIANATYDYIIDGTKQEGSKNTIPILFEVVATETIELSLTKTSNKNTYLIGEQATFTLTIINPGSTYIKNVIIGDNIPNNYEYIDDSVKLNGSPITGDIRTGVNIGELEVNATATITFEAATVAIGNNIANTFYISYTIEDTSTTGTKTSAPLLTNIVDQPAPVIILKKESDKQTYNQGEIIHYTITMQNTSVTIPASSLTIYDILDKNTSFIEGSAKLDGEVTTGTPDTGIDVGNLPANFTRKVTFDATAINPATNILNTAKLSYNYQTTTTEITEQINSNTITINILAFTCPKLSISKEAILRSVIIGNNNGFLLTIKNEGTMDINNVVVTDLLDDAYQYIQGSLQVGGKSLLGDITTGITISIKAGTTETIGFTAEAKTIKDNIINKANIRYTCNEQMMFNESNAITTSIIEDKKAIINIKKSFTKTTIKLNETNIITLNINNIGNTDASNILIKDELPNEYEFVVGSLKLDDTTIMDADIFEGITILKLSPKEEKKITFQVKGIKTNNNIKNTAFYNYSYIDSKENTLIISGFSNETTTQVTDVPTGLLTIIKKQEHLNLLVGEVTTVTLTVTNAGNLEIENINLIDIFAPNYEQVGTTVTVDGKEESADMKKGVLLNPMKPNQVRIVTFPMKAISSGKNIQNIAQASYTHEAVTRLQYATSEPVLSDITTTPIADLEITKMALPSIVVVGDIINYSFNIENVGKLRATNIYFSDILDTRLEIIPDSIMINGEPGYLSDISRIPLGFLDPDDSHLIEVQAKALSFGTNISNTSKVTYKYQVDGVEHQASKESNRVSINIVESVIPTVILNQTVTKKELKLNDINMFNFSIMNNSDFELHDFTLNKLLPNNYKLIPESLKMIRTIGEEEVITPLISPIIPIVHANEDVQITFSAYAILTGNNISNIIPASYIYTNLAGRQQLTGLSSTDAPTTILDSDSPNIIFTKDIAEVMQTNVESTITLFIQNQGQIPISKIRITELLPTGLDYVKDSLMVDNIPVPYSIIDGLSIFKLDPNQKNTITFKVLPRLQNKEVSSKTVLTYQYLDPSATTIEKQTEIDSNIQIVTTIEPIIDLNLFTDQNTYYVKDFINYRLLISLTGVTNIQNVLVKIPLPINYEFLDNSLIVNGKTIEGDITSGINIGNIISPKDTVILFRAKALSEGTNLPTTATIDYTYQIGLTPPVTNTITSNTVLNNILTKEYNVTNYKTCYKKGIILGEINTFTIALINASSHPISNIRISDTLDDAYQLIADTIKINNILTQQSLNDIVIDSLASNSNIIITFNVKAIKPKKEILNTANISYQYTNTFGSIVEVSEFTNTIITTIIKVPNHQIINLINQVAGEEGTIADLLIVEANKLERIISIGTLEDLLNINSLILEMISLLLMKEKNSYNSLITIINNL